MLQCSPIPNRLPTSMQLSNADLQQYLQHIGFAGTPRRDESTLRQLHALHPQRMPFGNLDSWLGRTVTLQPDQVFRKLVQAGREGYCFEHNQLFQRVLQALGFTVQGLSARVLWMLPAEVVLPRTHMALLVSLDDSRWIADVGFGGMTMTAPLLLHSSEPQLTPHEDFRVQTTEGYYTVAAKVQDQWQPLYRVSLDPCLPPDYETANWYVSTHPESKFVKHLIASRPDAWGRHALLDRRYTRHLSQQKSEVTELQTPQALRTVLQEQFQLRLDQLQQLDSRIHALFSETP
jgi:N-hydroxyarylamine O-acetyltransferase